MKESEQCDQCGFDSDRWTRRDLTHAFSYIAARAVYTLEDLPPEVPNQRPDTDTWSMLEYLEHVREVTWGHRFLVDMAHVAGLVAAGKAGLCSPRLGDPAPSIQRRNHLEDPPDGWRD